MNKRSYTQVTAQENTEHYNQTFAIYTINPIENHTLEMKQLLIQIIKNTELTMVRKVFTNLLVIWYRIYIFKKCFNFYVKYLGFTRTLIINLKETTFNPLTVASKISRYEIFNFRIGIKISSSKRIDVNELWLFTLFVRLISILDSIYKFYAIDFSYCLTRNSILKSQSSKMNDTDGLET